ncbi:threonine-phosphate decarboxylase CobD [Shewanella intestini]|uniref:threonine-phosphate decarboxylase n=1 Tax=Shewanella intestini TaxID=2017544 RepID=A0ABS5I3S4_9GAMM|nr:MULTISPECIES: threonine-phosphate decarboxylase CobD [Shewanella]MBR9727955.1 threonine-phosphate decarboxylase [Shewanella intestini]MRG36494.1 threonine-phosphate decarboxylase [Shewanella sp. XMDDZSB0408]
MSLLHHGGNLDSFALKYHIERSQWLDLSTGVSPWSYPIPDIPTHAWNRLPEQDDGLIAAAADYYDGQAPLAISGSQAAIQTLPWALTALRGSSGTVLLPNVGYKEHEKAWRESDWHIEFYDSQIITTGQNHDMEKALSPSLAQLARCDALVVINPNNPSGYHVPAHVLKQWYQLLAAKQGYLIVDEAFMDVTPQHAIDKGLGDQLVVLKSVGKFFGLAGIRAGFVFASMPIKNHLEAKLGPWTVNGPARYVCKCAFADTQWQQLQRQRLVAASDRLIQLLSSFKVKLVGTGLFQCAFFDDAPRWFDLLCQQGVLTRLTDERNAIRFGLPMNEAQWAQLTNALKQVASQLA